MTRVAARVGQRRTIVDGLTAKESKVNIKPSQNGASAVGAPVNFLD